MRNAIAPNPPSFAALVQQFFTELLTAVDSRTNPASTAGTAQHDLDLVSG